MAYSLDVVTLSEAIHATNHADKVRKTRPNITLGGAETYAEENGLNVNMFLTDLLFHNSEPPHNNYSNKGR